MELPKELKYTKTHEWIRFNEDGTASIGLTDYAQSELGGVVYVNLPEEGEEFEAGSPFADVESVKTVSDVNSPVSGKILKVNEDLLDAPEQINDDPYGSWLIVIGDITDQEELMDADAYAEFVEEEKAKES